MSYTQEQIDRANAVSLEPEALRKGYGVEGP